MMIDFIREHPREVKISIIFGVFNVILPLGLVTWFFNRAIDRRSPILWFSQPRDEATRAGPENSPLLRGGGFSFYVHKLRNCVG